MRLATAAEMRGLDRRAIDELGIPGVVLMENAGRATVEAIRRLRGKLRGERVVIVVGPGNNGGDGLVIARVLHEAGCLVAILGLVPTAAWRGEAAINWRIVKQLAIPCREIGSERAAASCLEELRQADFVVDAIFGTGLGRPVSGHFAGMIEAINQAGRPVVSVDIPSGLDSDSGRPLGSCVRATLTVTLGLAKPGLLVYPGAEYVGRLEVADIGLPRLIVDQAGLMIDCLDGPLAASLSPARPAGGHKGTFGHLLVVAGSQGKTGAALLAAHGALRSGVGLVSLGVASGLNPIFEASLLEAMTVPLPSAYQLGLDDQPAIAAAALGKDALVLGPGLGTAPDTVDLVRRLYQEIELPMVVDADALTALGQTLPLAMSPAPRVLTPHPGEMARLTGLTSREIQADRLAVASAYARESGTVLLLKGARTVIASPDGRLAINSSGNPGLAAGGMGDVLAGVIGALLAQGLEPYAAACLGAFGHGLAADRLAHGRGRAGFLASELAAELAAAFQEIASLAADMGDR